MKGAAYAAAQLAFCKRVCGQAPPGEANYTGDFDYMAVVNAAPLPQDSSLYQHKAAWEAFRKLFSEEWANAHQA